MIAFAITGLWEEHSWQGNSSIMIEKGLKIMTKDGYVPGVIGSKPPHILPAEARKKPVEKKDMFIDIGATSKEEAMEFGVRPGDSVVPVCEFTVKARSVKS